MTAPRISSGPALAPGAVLAGKYRVIRELGRGGVGVVVEAEHVRLRQRFAIKVLDPYFVRETNIVERFEREARGMAALKSSHVTNVLDVDLLPDGTPYMVMELLEGRDLAAELRQRKILPTDEALSLAIQACEGLEIVHRAGIVHRDLKPSNLFLVPTDRGVIVKVMDFGISKFEGNEVTRTGSSLGTPAYMSPEQVRSPRDVDARADLWSLGVILFRALSGTLPFDGEGITGMSVAIVNEPPKRLAYLQPGLPPDVVALVDRLLEKDREARFADASSVREALTVCLSQLAIRPMAPTIPFDADDTTAAPLDPALDSFVRSSAASLSGSGSSPALSHAEGDRREISQPSHPSLPGTPMPMLTNSTAPTGMASGGTIDVEAPRKRTALYVVAFVSGFLTLSVLGLLVLLRVQTPATAIPPASAPASEIREIGAVTPADPSPSPSPDPVNTPEAAPQIGPSATGSAAASAAPLAASAAPSAARLPPPRQRPPAAPPVRPRPPAAAPSSTVMPLLL